MATSPRQLIAVLRLMSVAAIKLALSEVEWAFRAEILGSACASRARERALAFTNFFENRLSRDQVRSTKHYWTTFYSAIL